VESFEEAYESFLKEQKSRATGARLERLNKIGAGEKRLLKEVVWPIFKSFSGFYLEYERIGVNGVKLYFDVFYEPLGIVFECDGFVVHAELITRERFTFERARVRSMAMQGYIYLPFSYDELDQRSEGCRKCVYELLGRLGSSPSAAYQALSLQEREILRHANVLQRSFTLSDVSRCLHRSHVTCRKYMYKLMEKQLISPVGSATKRHRYYELSDRARELFCALR